MARYVCAVICLWIGATCFAGNLWAATLAVITNQGSHDVSVIDTKTGRVVHAIPVDKAPAGVAVVDAGAHRGHAFVTATEGMALLKLDIEAGRVVGRVALESSPLGVAVSPNGQLVAVSMWYEDMVHVYSVADLSNLGVVAVGDEPAGLDFSRDGRFLFVAERGDDTVAVVAVEAQTFELRERIEVGDAPFGVRVDEVSGVVYVANVRSHDVSVIDGDTWRVRGRVAVGARPYAVVGMGDGRRAFVSNQDGESVSLIDGEALREIERIDVGSYPEGVDWADGFLYVANWFDDSVAVVDGESLQVLRRIDVGAGCRAFGRFIMTTEKEKE